ncbi:MAG: hypothetical protein WA445_09380, partial [Pseudolabrys sp.]
RKTDRRAVEHPQHEARTNQNVGPAAQVTPAPSGEATRDAAFARLVTHGYGVGMVSMVLLTACHALDRSLCLAMRSYPAD